MMLPGVTGTSCYDVHGLLAITVEGASTPVGRALDADLAHFRRPGAGADLSIVLGQAPACSLGRAIGLGDGLFADPEHAALTVQTCGRSASSPAHVRYAIHGDMRGSETVTVHLPNLRRIHSTWTRAYRALVRGRISVRAETQANELIACIVEPFLYYRLPQRGHVLVHAAGVAGGSAILLSGVSNVGKTLLTLRLLGRGLAFLGDDLVILDAHGNALPYPKRVNLERHDLDAYPGLVERLGARMPWFERRLFKRASQERGADLPWPLRPALSEVHAGARVSGPCPVRAVVHLRRVAEDDVALRESDPVANPGRTAANLFWEFNQQPWRRAHYHHALAFARDRDPLEDEAAHHGRVSTLLVSALARAKAYELRLPLILEERHIESAVDAIGSLA